MGSEWAGEWGLRQLTAGARGAGSVLLGASMYALFVEYC